MLAIRPFQVEVDISLHSFFTVDARTPEEADSIVERQVDEGELGRVTGTKIECSEACPIDLVDGEAVPDEEDYDPLC